MADKLTVIIPNLMPIAVARAFFGTGVDIIHNRQMGHRRLVTQVLKNQPDRSPAARMRYHEKGA